MGFFRFPIEYNALLDLIREEFGGNPKLRAFIDNIEPIIEQRDRVLEDTISGFGEVPAVFVTVAGDGTGDYTSIKTAIEATAQPGATAVAGTYIFVKPNSSAYDDNGAGAVNVTNRKVIVFATHPSRERGAGWAQPWNMDGLTATTGNALVQIIGLDCIMSGTEDFLTGSSGAIELVVEQASITSGRGVVGSIGSATLTFLNAASTTPLFTASTGATSLRSFVATNSELILRGSGTPPTFTELETLRLSNNSLTATGTMTWSRGTGSGGTGSYQFSNNLLVGGVGNVTLNLTANLIAFAGNGSRVPSTTWDIAVSGYTASNYATATISNAASESNITIGANTRAWVGGSCRSITLTGDETLADIQIDMLTSGTGITINGDRNFVVAAIRNGGSTAKAVAIASGADNNKVFYTGTGFGAVDTDAGSGNTINTSTPAAHAASHLPGGTDALTTASGVTLTGSNATGSAASFARSDHNHALGGTVGGDLTGSLPNPTLAAVITAGGPTGSGTVVPVITYDAKGRLTTVTTATIPSGSAAGTPALRAIGTGALEASAGNHVHALDDLSDVSAPAPVDNEVLARSAGAWVNLGLDFLLSQVFDAPQAYTPAITASGTAFVLGTNGTVDGWYTLLGDMVMGHARVSLGNGGGASPGTGTYTIDLPFATNSAYYTAGVLGATRHPIGVWTTRRDAGGAIFSGILRLGSASGSVATMNISAGGTVGAANLGDGGAVAVEDEFFIEFRYWV